MAVSKIPSCLLSYNLYSINKIEKGEKQIWWVIQTTSKQTEKATTSHAGIKDSKKKNQNQNISKKHAYIDWYKQAQVESKGINLIVWLFGTI